MTSPTDTIEIIRLHSYHGPHIYGPQPGVLLQVRSNTDRSKRLKNALKDAAQFVGMVLAYLDVKTSSSDDGTLTTTAHFTTPTPDLGAALAEYVVAGLRAEAARAAQAAEEDEDGDEPDEQDTTAPLLELQQRRRREALPMPALQLVAEARSRGLPVLYLPNGRVQFGYGVRSWRFLPAALLPPADEDDPHTAAPAVTTPPWQQIDSIPIYAVTGTSRHHATAREIAATLRAAGHHIHVLENARHDTTLALLSDTTAQMAVVSLDTADILRCGVAFIRCTQAIITDLDGPQPHEAATSTEWLQALGVPMLISEHPAILNTADPAIASLARYAPHGTLPLDEWPTALAPV